MTPAVLPGVGEVVAAAEPQSLSSLAVEIVAAHRSVLEAESSALLYAKHAGDLLTQAKAKVRHGEWLKWVAANCDLSPRVAQIYMQISKQWAQVEAFLNAYSDTHLGITGARLLLAGRPGQPDILEGLVPEDDQADDGDEDDQGDADHDNDEAGGDGCGNAGTGQRGDNYPQKLQLAFTVATLREFRRQVAALAVAFGITSSNETDRLRAVIAQVHTALARTEDEEA